MDGPRTGYQNQAEIKLVLQRPAQARQCGNCSHIDTAETPQLPCDMMAPISDCGTPIISRTLCCFLFDGPQLFVQAFAEVGRSAV